MVAEIIGYGCRAHEQSPYRAAFNSATDLVVNLPNFLVLTIARWLCQLRLKYHRKGEDNDNVLLKMVSE